MTLSNVEKVNLIYIYHDVLSEWWESESVSCRCQCRFCQRRCCRCCCCCCWCRCCLYTLGSNLSSIQQFSGVHQKDLQPAINKNICIFIIKIHHRRHFQNYAQDGCLYWRSKDVKTVVGIASRSKPQLAKWKEDLESSAHLDSKSSTRCLDKGYGKCV